MSAVAIVSVAAVCAGYLWLERHQVQRAARVRLLERRRSGALRWCEVGSPGALPASRVLERHIEEAVAYADLAWSYYDRLLLCGAAGESPFQLRRSRVDAAQRRFAVAAARLEQEAAGWLTASESDPESGPFVDDQSRLAVRRMQQWLREHPVPAQFPVGAHAGSVNATVDMLENALANLRQRRVRGEGADPFRRVSEGVAARQDVTNEGLPMSPRHVCAAQYHAPRAPLP